MLGGLIGGESCLLHCQIPVSCLHYVRMQFSFFCNFSCPARLYHNNLTFTCHTYKKVVNPASRLDPNETHYVKDCTLTYNGLLLQIMTCMYSCLICSHTMATSSYIYIQYTGNKTC